jgi:predicted esterase
MKFFILVLGWVALGWTSVGAVTADQFAAGSVSNAGFTMPYRYYVPGNNTTTQFPLILFLHGSGEVGNDNTAQLGPAPTNRANGAFALIEDPNHPAIMVAPQLNSGFWGDPSRQTLIFMILAQIRATYNVDPDHIYITGLSYGAAGTWNILGDHPDYFAAAVPISGSINNDARALFDTFAHVPMWLFHGDSDTQQHTDNSRLAATEIRKRGYNILHTEYTNTGHTGWSQSYASGPLREWLFAQTRGSLATGLPSCAITTPAPPATPSGYVVSSTATLSLGGTVTPPTGQSQVSTVTWQVFNGGGTQTSTGSATGTATWTTSPLTLSVGENQIQVIASGPSWNSKTGVTTLNDTLRVVYSPPGETTAPVVAFVSPTIAANYNTASSTLNLTGTATDNVFVSQVTWTNDRGGSGSAVGTKSWSLSGLVLQTGINVITVSAQDLAGNVGTKTLTVNYSQTNQAPVAQAGADTTITLPTSIVSLQGSVTDDGLPTGATVTRTWSKFSGPGTVTFGNDSNPSTTAAFSAAGTYVLRLTANDTQLNASDDVTVVVNPVGSEGQLIAAINCGGSSVASPDEPGLTYAADSLPPAVGGTATGTASSLTGSYRYAIPPATFSYKFTVPNGSYVVKLRFYDSGTVGQRVFNYVVEDQPPITGFDIAAVARNTLVDRTYNVVVADGELNIGFSGNSPTGATPKINAIVVRKSVAPATGYAAWTSEQTLNGAEALPEADPDEDRFSNLAEYFLGTNPKQSSLAGTPTADLWTSDGERYLTIAFQRKVEATDVSVEVERSTDLVHWSTVGTIVNGVPSGEGFLSETGTGSLRLMQFRDPVPLGTTTSGYLRLKITKTP